MHEKIARAGIKWEALRESAARDSKERKDLWAKRLRNSVLGDSTTYKAPTSVRVGVLRIFQIRIRGHNVVGEGGGQLVKKAAWSMHEAV